MSKKIYAISLSLLAAATAFYATSCKKELDTIVDCLAETSLTSINASVDPANTKMYTFHVSYGGTNNLGTVTWNFGDGSAEATTNGTATITHTYATEGVYKVIATPKITKDKEECNPNVEKNVVVND